MRGWRSYMGKLPKENDDGMIIIYDGVSDCKGDGNIYRDEKKGGKAYFATTRRQNLLKDPILIRWGWWRARWGGVKSMECFQEYRKTAVT